MLAGFLICKCFTEHFYKIQLCHCDVSKINNFVYNTAPHLINAGDMQSAGSFLCSKTNTFNHQLVLQCNLFLVMRIVFKAFKAHSLVGTCIDYTTRLKRVLSKLLAVCPALTTVLCKFTFKIE